MDDLDLYEDLDEFHEQHEKKSKELQEAEEKYQQSLKTIEDLKAENKILKKNIQRIELGFQSLLDTARSEIRRKDKEIERLRKEKDDICFRRKIPAKTANTDNDYHLVNNSSVNNPFKQNDVKLNKFSLTESAITSEEDVRQKTETHKRASANDAAGERPDSKRHRTVSNDKDDKVEHSFYKQHNVSHKTKEEYQSHKVRYRESDKNAIYKKNYDRSRSREREEHEKRDDRSKYQKSLKSSRSNDRYGKESYRNRSRERDKFSCNRKYFKESSYSVEHPKSTASSKSSSKSPLRGSKSNADMKHMHFKRDKNPIKTETENSKKILNKDLGKSYITNLKTVHKSLTTESFLKENEKSVRDEISNCANSHSQTEQIKKPETTKNPSTRALDKGTEQNDQQEIKVMEKSSFNGSTIRPEIFNEIFGKSPSQCGSISTNSSETPTAQSNEIEVISSATTSPGNYTDIETNTTTPINKTSVTSADEILQLAKNSSEEINNCFIPHPNVEQNFKTIGCVDLTQIVEDDLGNELDFIQIPGLDLCNKRVATKIHDNVNALNLIRENMGTSNDETDILTHKLSKGQDGKTLKATDINKIKLKEKEQFKNCENQTNLNGADKATIDKVRNINESKMLIPDAVHGLENASCVSSLLENREKQANKITNVNKVNAKENHNIKSMINNDFTNEIIIIDAKQCGGVVPLKNPYKIKESEQVVSLCLENLKPAEMQVLVSNTEKQKENKSLSGNKEIDHLSHIKSFRFSKLVAAKTNSTGHNHLALKSLIEEDPLQTKNDKDSFINQAAILWAKKSDNTIVQNEEKIKSPVCSKILADSADCKKDISKIEEVKTNLEIFLEVQQNEENLVLQKDELKSSLAKTEDSIKLKPETGRVVEMKESDEMKENDRITGEELYLNEIAANVAKDSINKDFQEEIEYAKEKCEEADISKSGYAEKEDVAKEEKVTKSTSFQNKQKDLGNGSISLSFENPADDDVDIQNDDSLKQKQEQPIEKNRLSVIERPVFTTDKSIQSSITVTTENESFSKVKLCGNDSSGEIIKQEETCTFLGGQPLKIKVNPFHEDMILGNNKLKAIVKVDELPATRKDKEDLENRNSTSSAEELCKNVPKVLNKSSKAIVQSVEMLPPIKIVQIDRKKITSTATSAENLEIIKSISKESLICATEHVVPSDFYANGKKIAKNEKEELHEQAKIIDLCSPIKTIKIEDKTILTQPEHEGESCTSEKFSKDDDNTRSSAVKTVKHSPEKSSRTKNLPEDKILQTPKIISTTKSCLAAESVKISTARKSCECEDEINLPTNAEEQYCESLLPEKSQIVTQNIKESSSAIEPKLAFALEEKLANKDGLCTNIQHIKLMQNKVVGTEQENFILSTPDQKDIEINSEKSTKQNDGIIFGKANIICEETRIINVNSDDEYNLVNEERRVEIIAQPKQAAALQTKNENLVENISQETALNEYSVEMMPVDVAKENIPTKVAPAKLIDPMEILLNDIHGIQSDQDESIVLKVSDLDLTDDIKDGSEETQTTPTNEQQSLLTLLYDLRPKDSDTEAETSSNNESKTDICSPIKESRNLLTSVTCQEDNFYNILTPEESLCSNKPNTAAISKRDDKSLTYSFTPAIEDAETCANFPSKEVKVINNSIGIKTQTILLKPSHTPLDDSSKLDPIKLKTCQQYQPLLVSEKASTIKSRDQETSEANKALFAEHLKEDLVNCSTKNNSLKQTKYPKMLGKDTRNTFLKESRETTPNKSIQNSPHLTKEYEIERKSANKYVSLEANSSGTEEGISTKDPIEISTNADEIERKGAAKLGTSLQTTDIPIEIINKSLGNQHGSAGPVMIIEQNSAVAELENDAQEKDETRKMKDNESDFKGVEKLNNLKTPTEQENRSSVKGERSFWVQKPKQDSETPSCSPSHYHSLAENPHLSGHDEKNVNSLHKLLTIRHQEDISKGISSSLQAIMEQTAENNPIVTDPSSYPNTNNSPQVLLYTKKIIYVKKVISKEINIEGEIVEVVKDIIDPKHSVKISNAEENTIENVRFDYNVNLEVPDNSIICDKEQHKESNNPQQQFASFPTLPSISATHPTPSNFSGIFSKIPIAIATIEDDLNKSKKKPAHLNVKRKEYILPAASVLCNVDNLENATKNNKKLHWELLDNKGEMTEIEDDIDIDTSDNDDLKIQEKTVENLCSLPKQYYVEKSLPVNSESDATQTENESVLEDRRQQKGKYKNLYQSKLHKSKMNSAKNTKDGGEATVIRTSNVTDGLQSQESLPLIVSSKRPVGRPRKLDKKCRLLQKTLTHKKRGRKSKKIVNSNPVETAKLDCYEEQPIELKENIGNCTSIESFEAAGKAKRSESYTDHNTKSLPKCDEHVDVDDVKSIENSLRSLSSSVEKLEICDEAGSSRDSFKHIKSFESQILDSRNQDDYKTFLIYHKQISKGNYFAEPNEQLEDKVDAKFTETGDANKNSELISATKEIQNSFSDQDCVLDDKMELEKITQDGLTPVTNDIPISPKHGTSPKNISKNKSYIETDEMQQEELFKTKSLVNPLFNKNIPAICQQNKGKNFISLEEIGITVRPPKMHLSSFRIPRIKKNPEDMINSSWKLEKYVELENMEEQNKTQGKDTQEIKLLDGKNPKDIKRVSARADISSKDKQTKTNSMELVLKEDVQLPTEKQSKETAKNLSSTSITNLDMKSKIGGTKLHSSHLSAGSAEGKALNAETKCFDYSRVGKTSQPDIIKHRRNSVHFTTQLTTSSCEETKSPATSTKPLKRLAKSYRRILDSSSDEDICNINKKIKLSPNKLNESSQYKASAKTLTQDQTISRGLHKNETNRLLRSRSKSLYVEKANIEVTVNADMQVNRGNKVNVDPRMLDGQKIGANKLQSLDTEKNKNSQPSKLIKMYPIQMASTKENIQQNRVFDKTCEMEIIAPGNGCKAIGRDAKKELPELTPKENSIQPSNVDSGLPVISTHQDRLNRRRKSTNQNSNLDDNKASDTTHRKIDQRVNIDASHNVKASPHTVSELAQTKDNKVPKKSASFCQNPKPENDIKESTQMKQSRQDQQVSNLKHFNSSHQDKNAEVSAIFAKQNVKSEPTTINAIVIMNPEKSNSICAEKSKRRKRRIVKVLSTSMNSPNSSTNVSQQSSKPPSPFPSPLLNHPIFNNDVSIQSSEFVNTLPLTPNQQDDSELKEIDSQLNEIFKSPVYSTDNIDKNLAGAASSPPGITKAETLTINKENDLNDSQINSSAASLNENQNLHNNSDVKYLSMGSSKYRFEKISDNVVNLFITRKRKRKSKN